ncbi:MAG: hypothetical protein IPH43_08630 [Xanthomonadales bacterium]|uniref:hypothetical protein n=1 Tax=Dokdonella sp. TaxID=2291710 RepID=UPI0031BDFC57|nr:hypothetical protein [Xanthomonadales bacterium]
MRQQGLSDPGDSFDHLALLFSIIRSGGHRDPAAVRAHGAAPPVAAPLRADMRASFALRDQAEWSVGMSAIVLAPAGADAKSGFGVHGAQFDNARPFWCCWSP